jgi:hypothetical protein
MDYQNKYTVSREDANKHIHVMRGLRYVGLELGEPPGQGQTEQIRSDPEVAVGSTDMSEDKTTCTDHCCSITNNKKAPL